MYSSVNCEAPNGDGPPKNILAVLGAEFEAANSLLAIVKVAVSVDQLEPL